MIEYPDSSSRDVLSVVMLTNNRVVRCMDCIDHTSKSIKNVFGDIFLINNGSQEVPVPNSPNGVECRIITPSGNIGAGARNLGLRETKSKYVLMLDDDAYINPQSIAEIIKILDSDSTIGAVALRVNNGPDEEACLLPTVFHGCACAFRTEALRSIGGYPDGYTYYGEEYDVAFRLYQAGYRIVMSNLCGEVKHVRDTVGRSKIRIIRLVMQNNVSLWVRSFPVEYVLPAIKDTVIRYMLIARKEGAMTGFIQGVLGLPWVIIRSLFSRSAMPYKAFNSILMIDKLCDLADRLNAQGHTEVVLCGTGKFPSIWAGILKERGVDVTAFLDSNTCWSNHHIKGIPVLSADCMELLGENAVYVIGLASLPESQYWKTHLFEENSSRGGSIDLLDDQYLEVHNLAA